MIEKYAGFEVFFVLVDLHAIPPLHIPIGLYACPAYMYLLILLLVDEEIVQNITLSSSEEWTKTNGLRRERVVAL